MSRLGKFLSEHYLATETRRSYGRERGYIMEYITDPYERRSRLRESRLSEISDLGFSHVIPTLMETGAITCSMIYEDPKLLWFVASAETLRLISSIILPFMRDLRNYEMDYDRKYKDSEGMLEENNLDL